MRYLSGMQLNLDIGDRPQSLAPYHARLLARYGTQGPFRQQDPISELVFNIIGGRTRTAVSLTALERLKTAFPEWVDLADADLGDIEGPLRDVTFPEVKARRVRDAFRAIIRRRGSLSLDHLVDATDEEAMHWLEALPGVGRKVSAAVLNFAPFNRRMMVIDAHHLRVAGRLGLIRKNAGTVTAYDTLMPMVPDHWEPLELRDHHQLMKACGIDTCRYNVPECARCCLADLCPVPHPISTPD